MLYFSQDKLIRKIHLLLTCFLYNSYFRLNYFVKYIDIVTPLVFDYCGKGLQKKTVLFIDSYFFTKAAAHWLNCNQIMHVGAIQKQHFHCISSTTEPVLEKSGTYCIPCNSKSGVTVTFCSSANKNLGFLFVLQAKIKG